VSCVSDSESESFSAQKAKRVRQQNSRLTALLQPKAVPLFVGRELSVRAKPGGLVFPPQINAGGAKLKTPGTDHLALEVPRCKRGQAARARARSGTGSEENEARSSSGNETTILYTCFQRRGRHRRTSASVWAKKKGKGVGWGESAGKKGRFFFKRTEPTPPPSQRPHHRGCAPNPKAATAGGLFYFEKEQSRGLFW
jgi:hypothetical protein